MIGRPSGVFCISIFWISCLMATGAGGSLLAQVSLQTKAEQAELVYPAKLDSTIIYAQELLREIKEAGVVSPYEEQMLDLLGRTYRRMGDSEKSESSFLESIALSTERQNVAQLGDSYNRLGLLYRGIGRFEEALESYELSIRYKKEAGNEASVASTLNNLGNLYRVMGDRDKAYNTFIQSIEIRERLGDHRNAASTYLNLGNWMAGEGNFEQARKNFNQFKIMQQEIGDTTALALVNSNIGALFSNQSQFDSALVYFLRSSELIKLAKISDPRRSAINFMGLGFVNEKLEYPIEAIAYYKKALITYNRYQDPENKSLAYQNIGKVFSDLLQADSSLYYYNLALDEIRKIGSQEREALLLNNIAVLHLQNNNFELALNYSGQAASIYEGIGEKRRLAEVKYNLGASWFYLGRYRQAINEYTQSLQLANETQNLEMQERTALGLAEVYGEIGDFQNAFKHQLMYDAYKDSLMSLDRLRVIEELITKYETEKVEAENELLVVQQAQNEATIRQRNAENRVLFIGMIALIGAIASIVAWVVYSNRKKRIIAAQKEALFQTEIDSLLNRQQLESVSAMLEGQEKERKRLAAELHDRLGSILSLVKLYFSSMDEDIKQAQPELYASFTEGNQFLDDAFTEVRALIKEMKEGTSSGEGLRKDIEQLLDKITRLGIEIKCRMELDKKLDTMVEMNVYRVVQEALSNSLKYSKAEVIELLVSDRDELSVTIHDNGVGFDPYNLPKKNKEREKYGVENMENRVKLLGGSFMLDARKDKGVTITVSIPIVEKDEIWGIPELE